MANKAAKHLRILVYPRIHITLLSLTSGSYRENGGLGFAVGGPSLEICIAEGSECSVVDNRLLPMPASELLEIRRLVERIHTESNYKIKTRVEMFGDRFLSHTGLGAGTAIRLAIAEGMSLLNGVERTVEELVFQSGRGGTSGVGVHTYFHGGYTFDLGRPSELGVFQSSDETREDFRLPLKLGSAQMPPWRIGLCFPKLPAPSAVIEKKLFSEHCPLPIHSSAIATFHSLFGVHASILERDYDQFCRAVNSIQSTEWKKAEWAIHEHSIEAIRQFLTINGADCVGMSSLGPALFFLSKDVGKLTASANKALGSQAEFMEVSVRNCGREIRHD